MAIKYSHRKWIFLSTVVLRAGYYARLAKTDQVAGREGRSLWQEKEGDRKEAKKKKKPERVIEVVEKRLLIFFTWMMEPRTVVHTTRRYGNFPVSLVKHAQEDCQKIQDFKGM